MGNGEFKQEIKRLLMTLGVILFVLGMICLCIEVGIGNGAGIFFFTLACWLPIGAVGIVIFRMYIERKTTMDLGNKNNNIVREIPREIPPAVASVLIDGSLEHTQDYLATIANLIAKGYIEVSFEEENENGVKSAKIERKKDDLSKLLSHEKFSFYCFCERRNFDEEEFRSKVITDAKGLNLIKIMKSKTYSKKMYKKNLIINIISIILMPVLLYLGILFLDSQYKSPINICYIITGLEFILLLVNIKTKAVMDVYKKQKSKPGFKFSYEKTDLGKEYAEKFLGLKNYLHEYTLVDDKNLDSVKLYGEYIAYAIALGEADELDKLVTEDYNLRNVLLKIRD